ncbi:SRPBCC domain-containing protein [Bradyrhizobium sp. LHD-71]|uniref:SRPBCC family protein n=1 Tax=Bradyrhizobium sp. LHD-71 TaxID=3072141 RepID=UPI00280F5949|nr:SRPBCC domain-containing protein [Bradyrhizobium sp. LHD-71]MDQ8730599.1 SRPBCC domain-containing protein [Bradyrhizobium sp. LHD-71]
MSAPTNIKAPRVEVTLTRTFDAPRALVWKAWTEPQMMARWWGPDGFTNPVCEMDVRVGGKILIHMQAPDGTVHPMTGIFDEVAEPECLVFRAIPVDRNGTPLLESLTTVTFHEAGGRTKIIVHASAVPLEPVATEMLKGMNEGWRQSLDRLADLVAPH